MTVFHLSGEVETRCPICFKEKSLTKQVTLFRTSGKNKKALETKKVGTKTEEFIEDSREELQRQKTELKEKA